MSGLINIGGRRTGPGMACYIIAEAGVNHNGRLDRAKMLIDAAVDAGADAVKFQSFNTGAIVTGSAPKAGYQKKSGGSEETQEQMLRSLELTYRAQAELFDYAAAQGIEFMSSPFDLESARMLKDLGVNCFKVASGCLTFRPLLEEIGSFGLPVILSTGMADMEEIMVAVDDLQRAGSEDVILLQCVTDYPADINAVNLRAMPVMGTAFDLLYGYSDHTTGDEAVLAAVAMGACVIEKHLTLDRRAAGPDHAASMMPAEFKVMVQRIRRVEDALGVARKAPSAVELENRRVCRYSIVSARPLKAGAVLAKADLTAKRPGSGISPVEMDSLMGRRLKMDVGADALIDWDMLEEVA